MSGFIGYDRRLLLHDTDTSRDVKHILTLESLFRILVVMISAINTNFANLTPDQLFDCIEENDFEGLEVTREMYERDIEPYFDEYIDALETLDEYAGISNAFTYNEEEVLEPLNFDEFLANLATYYEDVHPEWGVAAFGSSGISGQLQTYTHQLRPQGRSLPPVAIIYDETRRLNFEKDYQWFKLPGYYLAEGEDLFQFRLYDQFSQDFDPLIRYYELPQDAFVYLIESSITEIETYKEFEKCYLFENHYDADSKTPYFDDEVVLKLRQHGKKLLGVDRLEAELEAKYAFMGLKIETEIKNSWYVKKRRNQGKKDYIYDRIPVSLLNDMLMQLDKQLEKYPREYLSFIGLKEIHLFTNIYDPIEDKRLGGYADLSVVTYNGVVATFDHELFHCADYVDGLSDDDHMWGVESYGEDYELAFIRHEANTRPEGYASSYGYEGNVDHESERLSYRKYFHEDQAEVAERLLCDYQTIMTESGSDEVLQRKISLTKRFYYVHSGGRMDERFWQDLSSGQIVDANYWARRERYQVIRTDYYSESEFVIDPDGDKKIAAIELEADAKKALEVFDIDRAVKIYLCLAKNFPDDPKYAEELSNIVIMAGPRFVRSTEWLKTAIRKGSREPAVFETLTKYYWVYDLGKFGAAIDMYQTLVDQGVRNPALYDELANLYLLEGRDEDAITLYHLAIDPCRVDVKQDQAYVYFLSRFLLTYQHEISFEQFERGLDIISANLSYTEPLSAFYGTVENLVALQSLGRAKSAVLKAHIEHHEDAFLMKKLDELEALPETDDTVFECAV